MPAKKKTSQKKWTDEDWEEWGRGFAEKWAEKCQMTPWGMQKSSANIGGIIIALFVLAWGITWLGNDLGWWQFDFPFWAIIIILIGVAILISEFKKAF